MTCQDEHKGGEQNTRKTQGDGSSVQRRTKKNRPSAHIENSDGTGQVLDMPQSDPQPTPKTPDDAHTIAKNSISRGMGKVNVPGDRPSVFEHRYEKSTASHPSRSSVTANDST